MDENKKQVFISYSRKDYLDSNKQIIPGNAISKILDAFNKTSISYWIDEQGIYCGDEYAPLISKAIKACDIFLFISSEASNAADWTSNEIAAANMYKKKIIPFRLDDTTYNDSIILFIAKLDFIEYFKNPEKAISRLVSSVSEYLKEVEYERKKQEQEKEAAKKKREQEQKKLIGDIELAAGDLDNDERNAELKRRRLINSVQNVEDENERNRLMELIENSGTIYKKYKEEIQEFTIRLEDNEKKHKENLLFSDKERQKLVEELHAAQNKCDKLTDELKYNKGSYEQKEKVLTDRLDTLKEMFDTEKENLQKRLLERENDVDRIQGNLAERVKYIDEPTLKS